MDIELGSVLSTTGALTVGGALICIAASLICGLVIAFVYMKTGNYSRNFVVTLALLPALVQTVILMVSGSLGASVAVMGTFSLVRFRSVQGSSREIGSIFFAMALGLAIGMGYLVYAMLVMLVLCAAWLLMDRLHLGEQNGQKREVRIVIPEDMYRNDVFDDIFSSYLKRVELDRIKTTNLGSMFELSYQVEFQQSGKEKEFMDEIRVRNGNLTVLVSRPQNSSTEL